MFRGLSTLARLTPAALAAPAVALCDEKSARGALADLIDKSEARRGDGTSLGPTMVRLAWHSAGTFCAKTGTGGSDGGRMKYCPESAWGANAGLADVRKVVEKVAQNGRRGAGGPLFCSSPFLQKKWPSGVTSVSYTHLTLPTTPYV